MARRKEPRIPDAILDQLLAGAEARTAFDQGGLLEALKKAFAERALNAEMDHHLAGDGGVGNSRVRRHAKPSRGRHQESSHPCVAGERRGV